MRVFIMSTAKKCPHCEVRLEKSGDEYYCPCCRNLLVEVGGRVEFLMENPPEVMQQ